MTKRLTENEFHEVKLSQTKHRVRVTPFLNGKISNFEVCFRNNASDSDTFFYFLLNVLTLIFCWSRPRCRRAPGRFCWRESPTSWSRRLCRTCWRSTSRKTAMAEERSKPSCTTRRVGAPRLCSAPGNETVFSCWGVGELPNTNSSHKNFWDFSPGGFQENFHVQGWMEKREFSQRF